SIGRFVDRGWWVFLLGWLVLGAALHLAAPGWSTIAQDGEFSFLPADSPSRRADTLFDQAFPQDLLSSSIVVVVSRDSDPGLQDGDKQFITDVLKPTLEKIADETRAGADQVDQAGSEPKTTRTASGKPVVSRIR